MNLAKEDTPISELLQKVYFSSAFVTNRYLSVATRYPQPTSLDQRVLQYEKERADIALHLINRIEDMSTQPRTAFHIPPITILPRQNSIGVLPDKYIIHTGSDHISVSNITDLPESYIADLHAKSVLNPNSEKGDWEMQARILENSDRSLLFDYCFLDSNYVLSQYSHSITTRVEDRIYANAVMRYGSRDKALHMKESMVDLKETGLEGHGEEIGVTPLERLEITLLQEERELFPTAMYVP